MPRLGCTYAQFIAIIEEHGFGFHRQSGTSHRIYRGVIGGQIRLVTVSYHLISDEAPIGTLQSMIRQSGLSKKLFLR